MKSKVESVITCRLDKFYNKSFEDHEKVLFDKDGLQFINEYNSSVKGSIEQQKLTDAQIKKIYPLYPLPTTENFNCFKVAFERYLNHGLHNQGNQIRELSFFKTFILERNSQPPYHPNQRQWSSSVYKHNMSYDCLFAIKYFQVVVDVSTNILEEHPEYFKKNCSDFEALCRREYAEIEKTKKQLKSLMDENMSKKNYYASLDKKLKDFEQEKKQLEEEQQKLKEKKEKIVFIKEKLVEIKKEVELEKQKIL